MQVEQLQFSSFVWIEIFIRMLSVSQTLGRKLTPKNYIHNQNVCCLYITRNMQSYHSLSYVCWIFTFHGHIKLCLYYAAALRMYFLYNLLQGFNSVIRKFKSACISVRPYLLLQMLLLGCVRLCNQAHYNYIGE